VLIETTAITVIDNRYRGNPVFGFARLGLRAEIFRADLPMKLGELFIQMTIPLDKKFTLRRTLPQLPAATYSGTLILHAQAF